jgi:tRNA-dihydrouridine synthase
MLMVLLGSTWSRTAAFQSSVPLSRSLMRQRLRLFGSTASRSSATATPVSKDADNTADNTQSALYLPGRPDHAIRSIMAPMVASSDYAYRCLCRQYGVDLTYTQMLHSKNLLSDKTFWKNHLDLYECDDSSESNDNNDPENIHHDAPLMVQLAGHDVDTVVAAAQKILVHTNGRLGGFDLNLGCPQGIARKGNYGAFLMEQEEETVCKILAALRKAVPADVAVSAKIRLPLQDDLLVERIPRLLDTGINFMTIHGRTLYENKTKVAQCHTDRLRLAVETAQKHTHNFPVVANGGVEHYPDINRLRRDTGACAVMSSEALLERPNLFTVDSSTYTNRQVLEQQVQFASDYLSWCRLYPPLPGVVGTTHGPFNIIKGHLFKFLHRYLQEHPDIRDRLHDHQTCTDTEQAQALLDELYARYDGLSDEDMHITTSSSDASSDTLSDTLSDTSWYRRHRKAIVHTRPVHISSDLMGNEEVVLPSVEDRKQMAKLRIAKLQAQKLDKKVVGMKNL